MNRYPRTATSPCPQASRTEFAHSGRVGLSAGAFITTDNRAGRGPKSCPPSGFRSRGLAAAWVARKSSRTNANPRSHHLFGLTAGPLPSRLAGQAVGRLHIDNTTAATWAGVMADQPRCRPQMALCAGSFPHQRRAPPHAERAVLDGGSNSRRRRRPTGHHLVRKYPALLLNRSCGSTTAIRGSSGGGFMTSSRLEKRQPNPAGAPGPRGGLLERPALVTDLGECLVSWVIRPPDAK